MTLQTPQLRKISKSLVERFRLVVSGILMTCCASFACGQFDGGISDPALSLLTQADCEDIASRLSLTQREHERICSIIKRYENQIDTLLATIKEKREAIHEVSISSDTRPSPGNAVALTIAQKQKDILDAADLVRSLKSEMIDELRSQLDKTQVEQWDALIRDLRRSRTLRRSAKFSGETVDMVALVEEIIAEHERAPELKELLRTYAIELDAILIRRNAAEIEDDRSAYERQMAKMRGELIWPLAVRMSEPIGENPAEGAAIMARFEANTKIWVEEQMRTQRPLMALHRQVRDHNLSFISLLQIEVCSGFADRVQHRYLEKAYPYIFAPNEFDRWLDDIESMGLDEDQASSIQALRTDYYLPFRSRLDQTLKRLRDREEDAWEDKWNKQVDNTILVHRAETQQQKLDLLEKLVELATAMLTPTQRDQVGQPKFQ